MEEQELIEIKEDRKDALRDVKMWLANDYELKEETPEYFLLKKNEATLGGHIVILFLTGWFSFGICNLLYYLLSNKSKKIIK